MHTSDGAGGVVRFDWPRPENEASYHAYKCCRARPMKHTKADSLKRSTSFKAFVKANPPRLPPKATRAERKRVMSYARAAFITGFNSGENYRKRLDGDKG